jgi:hypothetical protein
MGDAFFHASTFETMLGVLLPASTSASMRVVPGGSAKSETSAAVAVVVHRAFTSGERVVSRDFDVSCDADDQFSGIMAVDDKLTLVVDFASSKSPRHSTANLR